MFGIRRKDGSWYVGTVDREAQWVSGWVDVEPGPRGKEPAIATFFTTEQAETRMVGLLESGFECEVVPV